MNPLSQLNNTTAQFFKQFLWKNSNKLKFYDYDRQKVTPGIIHFGLGNFHRSHLAYYVDQVLKRDNKWGILGIDFIQKEKDKHIQLKQQNSLYTVTQLDQNNAQTRIIGSIIDNLLYEKETHELILDCLLNQDIKMISLTVTEKGYYQKSEGNYELDINNDDILVDIKFLGKIENNNRVQLKTYLGVICQIIYLRAKYKRPPLTFVSCDNLQYNGKVLQNMVHQMIQHSFRNNGEYESIYDYLQKCKFPNSLVDRIVPQLKSEYIDYIKEKFQLKDSLAIRTEPFNQWIIEDDFICRPDFQDPNIIFVQDAIPYQQMKLRLLNGCHSFIGILGELIGYQYIHEVLQDKSISLLALKFMKEIQQSLDPQLISQVNIDEYVQTVLQRFSNVHIQDNVQRITMHTYKKIKEFILPALLQLEQAQLPYSSLFIATWLHYQDSKDINGNNFKIDDPSQQFIQEQIKVHLCNQNYDMQQLLTNLFGEELSNNKLFVEDVQQQYVQIKKFGLTQVIQKYIDNDNN